MTFRPYGGVVIIEAQDIKAIGQIIDKHKQPILGVVETLACMVIDTD
jgi:hypothetical protein